MSVDIKVVEKGRDLRRFVRFPFDLYKGCDQWVPPLIRGELQSLRTEYNPAFDHCRARYWLAYKDGRIVGRIAGIINERYIEKWNNRYARFGWVDFVDDPEVSAALFEAVEKWARHENMAGVHGPMGFTGVDPEGLLIEGFGEMGTMTEIYNYAYYPHHLESLGYRKDTDWVEYNLSVPDGMPEKAMRVGQLVLKRGGLSIVEAKKSKDLLPYAAEVFYLLNEAYAHLYGAIELTPGQIGSYTKRFFGYIDPRFNKVIVDRDGRLVAFGLIFPSLAEALRKARGRLVPFGFVHLKRALKNPSQLNFGLIAVRPEWQGRGIPAIMMTEVTRAAHENGITNAETGRELVDNTRVRSLWKSFNARQHKRRRVYLKDLA